MSDVPEKKVDIEATATNPDNLEPIESIKAGLSESYEDKTNKEFYGASITDSYRLKSELVGKAMEEIGMGRYQWEIFIVTGFGWICDNFWSQGLPTIQPAVNLEFDDISRVSFSSVAYCKTAHPCHPHHYGRC